MKKSPATTRILPTRMHFRMLVMSRGTTFGVLAAAARYPLRTLYLLASGHIPRDRRKIELIAQCLKVDVPTVLDAINESGRLAALRHGGAA